MKISPLELVVVEGGGKHSRFNLGLPHVILGRLDPGEAAADGCCLFPEPTVSKVHAVLDWDEKKKRYVITHRSATNATLVNGKPLKQSCHLSPGDKVRMGRLTFELRIGIGQHSDAEIGQVDVAHLTRSVSNTPSETLTWIGNTPLPAARPKPVEPAPVYPAAQAPDRIPPPPRRPIPSPDFSQPYSPTPVDPAAREAPAIPDSVAAAIPSFGNPDEVVAPVVELPRRIALGPMPPLPPKVNLGDLQDVPTDVLPPVKPKLVWREAASLDDANESEAALSRSEGPAAETLLVDSHEKPEAAPPTALMRAAEEPAGEIPPVDGQDEPATSPPTALRRSDTEGPAAETLPADSLEEPEAAPPTGAAEEPAAEIPPLDGQNEPETSPPTALMRAAVATAETFPVDGQEEPEAAPPTVLLRLQPAAAEEGPPHTVLLRPDDPAVEEKAPAKTAGKGKGRGKAKPPEEQPKQQPFVRASKKVGRNEKCPCGSGQKYKKCCGA